MRNLAPVILAALLLCGCAATMDAISTTQGFEGDLPPGEYATISALVDGTDRISGIYTQFASYKSLETGDEKKISIFLGIETLKLLPGSYLIGGKCSTMGDRQIDPYSQRKKNQVQIELDVEAGIEYLVHCERGEATPYALEFVLERPVTD